MLKPRLGVAPVSRIKPAEAGTWTKSGKTMYGWPWQKARAAYLREHPLCVNCKRDGRVTLAKVVDHIVPHRGRESLFWDQNNWQPMCKACHDAKTAREDGGFGNVMR